MALRLCCVVCLKGAKRASRTVWAERAYTPELQHSACHCHVLSPWPPAVCISLCLQLMRGSGWSSGGGGADKKCCCINSSR